MIQHPDHRLATPVEMFPQSSGIAPSENGFSSARVLARILLGENGGGGEWGNGGNLQTAFQALPSQQQEQIRNRWGSHLNEIFSLSRETDAELFYEALFHLGQRLERAGRAEQAGLIYSTLLPPVPHSPIPPFSTVPAPIQQQAQERVDVLQGGGSLGNQMEHMGQGFARQALDPGLLLGATGMGLFGKGVELIGMRYLAGANFFRSASGIARTALEFAPRATGFAIEATAFPFAINGANTLLGRPVSWAHMDHRILGSWFFLGGMRVGGGFGRMTSQRFGIPGLQPLGSIAGVGLGHGGEVLAGLKEWHGFSNFAVETFGTWANLQVAGRFSEYVFDGQISRMQRIMDLSIEGRRASGERGGIKARWAEWVQSVSEGFDNMGNPPMAASAAGVAPGIAIRRSPFAIRSPKPLEDTRSYMTASGGGGPPRGPRRHSSSVFPAVRPIPVADTRELLRHILTPKIKFSEEFAQKDQHFVLPGRSDLEAEKILRSLNTVSWRRLIPKDRALTILFEDGSRHVVFEKVSEDQFAERISTPRASTPPPPPPERTSALPREPSPARKRSDTLTDLREVAERMDRVSSGTTSRTKIQPGVGIDKPPEQSRTKILGGIREIMPHAQPDFSILRSLEDLQRKLSFAVDLSVIAPRVEIFWDYHRAFSASEIGILHKRLLPLPEGRMVWVHERSDRRTLHFERVDEEVKMRIFSWQPPGSYQPLRATGVMGLMQSLSFVDLQNTKPQSSMPVEISGSWQAPEHNELLKNYLTQVFKFPLAELVVSYSPPGSKASPKMARFHRGTSGTWFEDPPETE